MICTLQELLDISHFIYPICEVSFLNYSSKFKRVFHITHFFVTTFFVITMQTYKLFVNYAFFRYDFFRIASPFPTKSFTDWETFSM